MWRGLKVIAPEEVALSVALAADWRPAENTPDTFNELCAIAAAELRKSEQPNFVAAAEAARDGSGLDLLTGCLDLAAITRHALDLLPDWLGRMTDEKAAVLRLTYKDVDEIADDGGPKLFEMLIAHLSEPWPILRVISGAMSRPTDTYLASSEFASFGERLLDDIDTRLAAVGKFDADAGQAAAKAAAETARIITLEIAEFETSLTLSPESIWGRRVAKQKRALATIVESHLRAVDDFVGLALPIQTLRVGPRTLRGVPRLTTEPETDRVERAMTALLFMNEIRPSASAGGFASARTKAADILNARLDQYVEHLLDHLHDEETDDADRARAYLEVAAEFCGLVRDEQSAQLVRRRAAAA
jgi:hypothetical protein